MSAPSLAALVDAFFKRSFSIHEAAQLFGPEGPALRPNVIPLGPSNAAFSSVWLELLRVEPAPKPPFVCGLSLRLVRPAPGWLDEIERRLGRGREMPRLKPDEPIPYQFLVRGLDHDGYVLVRVDDGPRAARGAILRRFPPTLAAK